MTATIVSRTPKSISTCLFARIIGCTIKGDFNLYMRLISWGKSSNKRVDLGSVRGAIFGEEGKYVIPSRADEEDGLGEQLVSAVSGNVCHNTCLQYGEVLYLFCHGDGAPLQQFSETHDLWKQFTYTSWKWEMVYKTWSLLTVESRIPDPPEAKFAPAKPLRTWWLVLFTRER